MLCSISSECWAMKIAGGTTIIAVSSETHTDICRFGTAVPSTPPGRFNCEDVHFQSAHVT